MDAPRYAFVSDFSDIVSVIQSGLAQKASRTEQLYFYVKGMTNTTKPTTVFGGLGHNVKVQNGTRGCRVTIETALAQIP